MDLWPGGLDTRCDCLGFISTTASNYSLLLLRTLGGNDDGSVDWFPSTWWESWIELLTSASLSSNNYVHLGRQAVKWKIDTLHYKKKSKNKIKAYSIIQQIPLWGTYLKELIKISGRHLHSLIYGTIFRNSQDIETTQTSTDA